MAPVVLKVRGDAPIEELEATLYPDLTAVVRKRYHEGDLVFRPEADGTYQVDVYDPSLVGTVKASIERAAFVVVAEAWPPPS